MQKAWLAALVLSAMAVPSPSHALEAGDTMATWRDASSDEKARLVTELLKQENREGATSSVVACLDAAAETPGHADLPIKVVVKACEKGSGEPT